MTKNALWLSIDGAQAARDLRAACEQLDGDGGEAAFDFSAVQRVDAEALRALTELAGRADAKAVKVVLHGVTPGVYRVLQLMKLAPRFSFVG